MIKSRVTTKVTTVVVRHKQTHNIRSSLPALLATLLLRGPYRVRDGVLEITREITLRSGMMRAWFLSGFVMIITLPTVNAPTRHKGTYFIFANLELTVQSRHRTSTLIVRSLYLLLYGELFDQCCSITCTVETPLASKAHSKVSVYSSR
jgi:hypothetical protein